MKTEKIQLKDIASFFNVHIVTINRWKKQDYTDIFNKYETAIKKGKRTFFLYDKQILSDLQNEFDQDR